MRTGRARVEAPAAKVAATHGALDIPVVAIWAGEHLVEWGKPLGGRWRRAAGLDKLGMVAVGDSGGLSG